MSLSRAVWVCWMISVASAAFPQYYLMKQSLTWLEAVSYCKSQYTDLVSTVSDLEILPVMAVAGSNEIWIGLYLCSAGDWRWSNGVSSSYTKWNSGQPSRSVNSCVRLSSGKWSDADCGAQYYFVCYKLSGSVVPALPSGCLWPVRPTTVPMNTSLALDSFWTASASRYGVSQPGMGPGNDPGINPTGSGQHFSPGPTTASAFGVTTSGDNVVSTTTLGSTGQSSGEVVDNLHLVQMPMTWAESRNFCRTFYLDLATISSYTEQARVASLLSNHIPSNGFWFGLKRNRFWGYWYWSDGQTWGQYSSWAESEPDNSLSKLCVIISGDVSRNFTWSSECCAASLPFVCYGE